MSVPLTKLSLPGFQGRITTKLVHGTGLAGVPFKFFITGSPGNGTDSAR